MTLRSQLIVVAEIFRRKENLAPLQIPTLSEDLYEQLKLVHKIVDFSDRATRMICVTLVWYNVDNTRNSKTLVPIFERKKDDDNLKQNL